MAVYQGARRRTVLPLGPRAAYGTNRSAAAASTLAPPASRRRRQGTAPAGVALPGQGALPRRRQRGAVRAGRQARPVRLLLGVIVVAFLLAFFSLAQTVRLTATDYEVDRLLGDRDRLEAKRLELLADLNRLGREPAVRRMGLDLGLAPLGEPMIVPAR